MSQSIFNGQSVTLPIQIGEKLTVVAVSGTYSIVVVDGVGDGTSLATSATGGTYGPYAYSSVVRVSSSALSEIDYDVGVTTSIVSDTVVKANTDALTGGITSLQAGGRDPLADMGVDKSYMRGAAFQSAKHALLAQLSKAVTGSIGHIGIAGDSTAGGTGASNVDVYSLSAQFSTILATRGIANSGTGLVPQYRESANSAMWSGASWSDFGRTSNMMQGTTARTFISTVAGTVVNVMYGHSGGSFDVAIDGAGAVRVNTNASNTFANYTVTGLSNATHTVVITPVSTASHIYGAEVRAASGLSFSNFGIGGAKASEIFSTSSWFHTMKAIVAASVKVCFVRAAVNDIGGGVATASTVASCLAGMQYLSDNGVTPILLTACFYQNNDSAVATQADALIDAAIAAGFAAFDSSTLYGAYASALALGWSADAVHPGNAGYGAEAIALLSALV